MRHASTFFNDVYYSFRQDCAIVTVWLLFIKDTAICLIRKDVKHILLEKPGGINASELEDIRDTVAVCRCKVYVGYNRRFYESVREAKRRIEADGGIKFFNFEFTEWSDVVMEANKPVAELQEWFMDNFTHVVELAFYPGDKSVDRSYYITGKLPRYSKTSAFVGAGCVDKGVFSPIRPIGTVQEGGLWKH